MTETLEDIVELQYFLKAISYFCAASMAWENRPAPDTLIAPVTHLVGHGVELTLKANLILQGFNKTPDEQMNKIEVLKEMDRAIRAFIVREIKVAKRVSFVSLVDLVAEKFKVSLNASDIAGTVEDLLSNDFIQRNKDDENLFEFK